MHFSHSLSLPLALSRLTSTNALKAACMLIDHQVITSTLLQFVSYLYIYIAPVTV